MGGTDQKFNLLMGRELQKHFNQKPQTVITLPLLVGLDGTKKMSKSLGNYIGIDESPNEIFGKVMSISDVIMWEYFELVSFQPAKKIQQWHKEIEEGLNPRDVKFKLAEEIVERFHGKEAAKQAHENFVAQFQQGAMPKDLIEVHLSVGNGLAIANVIKAAGLTDSTSDAIRMIEQGAVKIDGEKVNSKDFIVTANKAIILQVGRRRFAKIFLK